MPPLPSKFAMLVPLAAVAIHFFTGCGRNDHAEDAGGEGHESAIVVQTAPAERRAIEMTVPAIGRAEALPSGIMTLTAAVGGQVAAILKTHGDTVRRGDAIVELDKTLPKVDLAEKEAARDMLKAALALLEAPPRPEDRRGLEIAVDQTKAAVDRARAALERLRPIEARKELSDAQLFEAEQQVVQARLQQDGAVAQLKLLLVGPRPEAVDEAKARLAGAEEAVAMSRANLELHTITAAIDGVLDSVACHPGQTIAVGTPIGEIVDTGQLNVVVWLPAESAAAIRPGQLARVVGGIAPRSPGETADETAALASGKITSIGQIVDTQTGNLPVRALFDNHEQRIAIGQTLSVAIVTGSKESELVVPNAALIDLGEGPLVVVVRDGKAVRLALDPRMISTHGRWTATPGVDLQPGEPVVIEGGFNLPEDAEVRVAGEKSEPAPESHSEAPAGEKMEAGAPAGEQARPAPTTEGER